MRANRRRGGNPDGISDPSGVARKGRLQAVSDDFGGPVGDAGDPQFVVAIRTINTVSEPFAIGRKAAIFPEGDKRFPPAVVGGRNGRF